MSRAFYAIIVFVIFFIPVSYSFSFHIYFRFFLIRAHHPCFFFPSPFSFLFIPASYPSFHFRFRFFFIPASIFSPLYLNFFIIPASYPFFPSPFGFLPAPPSLVCIHRSFLFSLCVPSLLPPLIEVFPLPLAVPFSYLCFSDVVVLVSGSITDCIFIQYPMQVAFGVVPYSSQFFPRFFLFSSFNVYARKNTHTHA